MMRTPSKVMMISSSPGRAEKLPAPMLTTLLRGKGGSRSRGRSSSSLSRSSPMFAARRRSASASSVDIQEEKEPSSPKVTCIGQVRISKRKSSASNSSSSSSSSKQHQQKQGRCVPRGCRCLQRGFFCNPFSKGLGVKFKPSSASPYRHHDPRGWRKWFLLPRSGCYWQREAPRQRQQQQLLKEEPPRMPGGAPAVGAGSGDEDERSDQGEVDDDEEEETKVFVPTTPPKNALLLMRCRSAPHRAAGLPDRLWASSPYGADADGAVSTAVSAPTDMEPSHGRENWGEEPVNHYSVSTYEPRVGINDGGAEESRKGEEDDGEASAVGPSPSFSSRPLILTRCKSEPAMRAAKLAAPEASHCFWNGGGGGGNQSSKPRNRNSNNKMWLTLLGEARPIPSQ